MADDVTAEDEARRRFVDEVDALNLRAQVEGPDPDSAARMKALIADHERKLTALGSVEVGAGRARGGPRRRGS